MFVEMHLSGSIQDLRPSFVQRDTSWINVGLCLPYPVLSVAYVKDRRLSGGPGTSSSTFTSDLLLLPCMMLFSNTYFVWFLMQCFGMFLNLLFIYFFIVIFWHLQEYFFLEWKNILPFVFLPLIMPFPKLLFAWPWTSFWQGLADCIHDKWKYF